MIDKKRITELTEEWLKDKEYFLVDTDVNKDNKITVEIDHKDGVWIEDCCELSRFINEQCQPEIDDYELEVGSAGIGQPFKVLQQYINNIGYDVELLRTDGKKQQGELTAADEDQFTVLVQEKQKVEGKKRPQMVDVEYKYKYPEVKWVKAVIDFK
ncbi:MAG: ribosome assembly cofactor RimP [Bacteroidaceae bacterium]|jgi:ribosome maturation factor RimP|nr:ribosome assembly cofactor RimP [Bacteroidaceae bacterium]